MVLLVGIKPYSAFAMFASAMCSGLEVHAKWFVVFFFTQLFLFCDWHFGTTVHLPWLPQCST